VSREISRWDIAVARVVVAARIRATGDVPLSVDLGGVAGLEREAHRYLDARLTGRAYNPHGEHVAKEEGLWEELAEEFSWEDTRDWKDGRASRPVIPWKEDFQEKLEPGVKQIFREDNG
jgi:hypothetical protein